MILSMFLGSCRSLSSYLFLYFGKMGPFLDWELLPYQVAKFAKLKSLRDDRPRELAELEFSQISESEFQDRQNH